MSNIVVLAFNVDESKSKEVAAKIQSYLEEAQSPAIMPVGDAQNPPIAAIDDGDVDAASAEVNVINRVASLPMVSSTLNQITNAYNWTKDKSSLAKYTLEMAESTVAIAAQTAQPVINRLEGPISAANNFVNQQMDKLEEKVPMITDSPDKVLANLQEGTIQVLDSTKKAGSDRINNLLLTRMGKVVTCSMDTALLLAEFAVDYYLPQEAAVHGSADGDLQIQQQAGLDDDHYEDMPSDKPLEATVQRASRVTNKVRQRVVNKAMRNVRYAQRRSKETLDKLHYTVDLIEYARTNIDSANQSVRTQIETTQQTLWKTWDDWTLEEGEGEEEGGVASPEVDATIGVQKTIAIARSLARRLSVLSGNIVITVRILPKSLRSSVEEGHELATSLYNSLEELSDYDRRRPADRSQHEDNNGTVNRESDDDDDEDDYSRFTDKVEDDTETVFENVDRKATDDKEDSTDSRPAAKSKSPQKGAKKAKKKFYHSPNLLDSFRNRKCSSMHQKLKDVQL